MKPEIQAKILLGVTRSKAKMFEFNIPEESHINITHDPAKLFSLTIGLLGDLSVKINRGSTSENNAYNEIKSDLLFSANFFDAFLKSRFNKDIDSELKILGSASYYLCDLPGSSSVLIKYISGWPNLNCEGLESLLIWILKNDYSTYFNIQEDGLGRYINEISHHIFRYFNYGDSFSPLLDLAQELRNYVYENGSARQLLYGDVISALIIKKIENSSRYALPLYSGLSGVVWESVFKKDKFVKELWPAQHLLGKHGVFKGKSAIVQMPTSAGKTKATELILRSAFLDNRVKLAVVIAPFRALCHEIKNSLIEAFHNESIKVDEISDIFQSDFDIKVFGENQQIIVLTPEKLLYVLRHTPKLADCIGLLIFDEGHQFDNGKRGITYELLLTSLNSMVPVTVQKILISAVISNAESVGEWLSDESAIVKGTNLIPTYRSLAFASFTDLRGNSIKTGWIKYVNPQDPKMFDYFVPQVIEKIQIERKKGESLKNPKIFPNPEDGKEIAIFLGLKLVSEGAVAIFCGRKDTASNLCELASERFSRNLPIVSPAEFSDKNEITKLDFLISQNLGSDSQSALGARIGVFTHHGNTPHGIRLAVEHAMRNNLIRFVICTSTLAQGVNLPIRYLIVSGVQQGRDRIKVRDFHNLLGRAGRAGMHTEGSVIFADPNIYDGRNKNTKSWRWKQVLELLEPRNSEPCISNLLSIFEPIKNDDSKFKIRMEALDFAKDYINNPNELSRWIDIFVQKHEDKGFSHNGVEEQVSWRISLINAVESFLLFHWDDVEGGLSESEAIELAKGTLAFHIADEQKQENIKELFHLLFNEISVSIPDASLRKVYGRTLYGIRTCKQIEEWVRENTSALVSIADASDAIEVIWPLLTQQINSGIFTKFDKPEVIKEIAQGWIEGKAFYELFEIAHKHKTKMICGTRRSNFKIDHMVELCEGAFAYDGNLLVNAVCEFIELFDLDESGDMISQFQIFQKSFKYGLSTESAINVYELGFSDRVIAQDLVETLSISDTKKDIIIDCIKTKADIALKTIKKYPSYFQERLNEILNQ